MDRKPDDDTMRALGSYLKKIREVFKPKKILLFGSRARGDNLKSSDFDLVIVSEKFEGVPFRDRIISATEFWEEPWILQPLCYTPEEFDRKKKQLCIVKKAAEEGIAI